MKYGDMERAALDAALSCIGVEAGTREKELILRHLELLFEKNKQLNLTRVDGYEEAICTHVEDSLAVLPELAGVQGEILDIGTGGGFPGIPLAIVCDSHFTLLDSVKKKAAAVQGFVDALGLPSKVEVLGMRSEELACERPGFFDAVVMRAVSSLAICEELAVPLLKTQGRLVLLKGRPSEEERESGMRAAELLGLKLSSERSFSIGEKDVQRSVYSFTKEGEPSVRVPRRPGMAVKRPLA